MTLRHWRAHAPTEPVPDQSPPGGGMRDPTETPGLLQCPGVSLSPPRLPRFVPFPSPPAAPKGSGMRLRICTWNVNSVRLRHEQAARFVREQAPDVLCLQEIKCREGEFPREAF